MTRIGSCSQSEQSIQKGIRTWLKKQDIYCMPTKGGPHTRAGDPDLVACVRGRFVGLEVKTPTGRQSDIQKLRQEEIEHNGGIYALVRSLDDAKRVVSEVKE